jgi:hypothetical protein
VNFLFFETSYPANKTFVHAECSTEQRLMYFTVPVSDKTYDLQICPTGKRIYSEFSSEFAARVSPGDFCPLEKRYFEIWLPTILLCLWNLLRK